MTAFDDLRARCEPGGGWAASCYLYGPEPLPTGTVVDYALKGGLMPGVTVLGGEASVGKSALACHVAASVAASGRRVLYLTLDDAWGNVEARCMSAWSVTHAERWGGEPFSWSALPEYRRALRPHMTGDPTRDAFELRSRDYALQAAARWEDGPGRNLAVVDDVTDAPSIERMVRDMAEDGSMPALVVVDYVQQYETGTPELDKAEYSRVSEVAARLQRLSLWGGFPLLMLSSLRKLGLKDEAAQPSLDWYRGSGVIGYSAWAALVMTRREGEAEDGERLASLHVVKNKSGQAQVSVPIGVYGAYSFTTYDKDGRAK